MYIRRRAGWTARPWFMSETAINPFVCFADGEGEGEGEGEGAGGAGSGDDLTSKTPEELISMINSLQGNKQRSDTQSKNFKSKVSELESELQRMRDEEAARLLKEAEDEGRHEELAKQANERATAAETKLSDLTKKLALTAGLDAIKVGGQYKDAVTAMMQPRMKVDGDKVTIDGESVSDFLKTWAETDAGKAFIVDSDTGGGANGGSNGGGSGKTMTRSAFDKLSPTAKAEAMKAGTTLTD